jgi:hypothetical protein
MAKLGKLDENLVAQIARALHPGAAVEIGEWIDGPDGAREVDVSVRGYIDGKQTFILIECKDWKKDVGIEEIDALDSKRHDVGADITMIVSNGGFTAPALLKAQRKEIMCFSALAEGNDIVRFILNREFLAKQLSIESYSLKIDSDRELPQDLKIEEVEYHDRPLAAWLRDRSMRLLRENELAAIIHHHVTFKQPVQFSRHGHPVFLRAMELDLECKRFWLVQTIREDVSRGFYDHLKHVTIIPDKELLSMQFDPQKWQKITQDGIEAYWPMLGFNMVLFNPIFGTVDGAPPPLDEFIDKEDTAVEAAAGNS